jgi:hypothetical protein
VPYTPPKSDLMPGEEAIQHICQAEDCSTADAKAQLQASLAHGAVGGLLRNLSGSSRRPYFPPWKFDMPRPSGPGGFPETSSGTRQIPSPKDWARAKIYANGSVELLGQKYRFDVLRENVLRIWPAKASEQQGAADNVIPIRRSGRPTSESHVLILDEARRRINSDKDLPKSLKEFANHLQRWLATEHDDEKPLAAGYIQTIVRHLWNNRPRK